MDRRFDERLSSYDLNNPGSKREYNRRLFSVVAGRYDAVTTVLSFGRDRRWKGYLLSSLPKERVHRALDVACGTGDLTFGLARHYPKAQVFGVDLTPEMLLRARIRARRFSAHLSETAGNEPRRIRFELEDMSALPYEGRSFDLVTAGYALRNAPDLRRTLASLYRVLERRGVLAILDFSHTDLPVLAAAQTGLLRLWGRIWGHLLHGNPEVYGYISESLKQFPSRRGLEDRLRETGFRRIRSRAFFLGLITVTFARK